MDHQWIIYGSFLMYDFHRHQSRSQVQLAALRATVELLDGVAEGEARA